MNNIYIIAIDNKLFFGCNICNTGAPLNEPRVTLEQINEAAQDHIDMYHKEDSERN